MCALMRGNFLVLSAMLVVGCAGKSAIDDQTDAPTGLWAWSMETIHSAPVLRVQEKAGRWLVSVDGQPKANVPAGQAFSVELSDGQRIDARFDDWTSAESDDHKAAAIVGQWFQASSSVAYSDMVTLFSLPPSSDGVTWEATVNLQARPFRVYLEVFVDEDDKLLAVIRNPERNEIMRRSQFSVERSAKNSWDLVSGTGDRQQRHKLTREGNHLQLNHTWFDDPLRLQRIDPVDAVGYFSRPDGESARYTEPEQLDDGWVVASAEDTYFVRAALDAMVQELASADPRSGRPRLIHALLVAHKGKLVVEEYFHGYDRETTHDSRSMSKVFAPVLVGALQQKGHPISADDRPIPAALEEAGESMGDRRKKAITLAHLMSFTSGLDCDVNTDSPGNEDNMWSQQDENDFWLYTSRLDLPHEPGERYAYCSGSINLTGYSIRATGKKPIFELFDELIAKPLDFGPYHWNLMPNGEGYLGGGVYLRPRDVLKIGALHASGGVWKEQRILPAAWVEESTTPVIEITPETTGMTAESFQNSYFGGAAAYEWRIDDIRSGDRTYSFYSATGNGGQMVLVVPELELVAVFMGGNYRQGGIWGRWPNEIIGGHVIPALVQALD